MKRRGVRFSVLAFLCAVLFLSAAVSAQDDPPAASPSDFREGLVHTVVKGDTLWDLSGKYLGSPWLWTELWERNRFLTNPHYIYPGIEVVVFPPSPKEYAWEVQKPPSVSPAGPGGTAPFVEAATSSVEEKPRMALSISPEEYVRAGEFTPEPPTGIGAIREGEQPKVAFSEGDQVYLDLTKEIPEDQILGIYRVRGPVRSRTARSVSGYVSYLVGVLQVTGKHDGRAKAVVRKSFEDLSREDLIREEIPSYSPVFPQEGAGGVEAFVITGRSPKVELATGDFVYLDRGADAGVALGDVFRVYDGRDPAAWDGRSGDVRTQVGKAVVVRVLAGSATAYITSATQSFPAGAVARGGGAGSR